MPSFIVLAQLYHCFLEGVESTPPVVESQKKPGLNRVKLMLFQIKDIYHRKLQTDGIAELNKGSLTYSEQNKLGEGSYGDVYHGDYEGISVLVKQFCLLLLRQMFLRDLQTIRHDILRSKWMYTVLLLRVTQLLFYRTAEKKRSQKFLSSLENLIDGLLNSSALIMI